MGIADRGGAGGQQIGYVFVLGTGRCGSTLVHEVLAKHPDAGFVSNLEDRFPLPPSMGRWNNALFRKIRPAWTMKGRLRYAPSEAYRALDRDVSPMISIPCRDLTGDDATPWLTRAFRAFFEERARAQGKPVFLHKFTGWPRAAFIHRVFPEARFIHVVRDGRAVANSLLQMPWWRGYRGPAEWGFGPLPGVYAEEWERSGRSFLTLAGLEWKLLIDAFEQCKREIPAGQWLEVRYEDVVSDPTTQLAAVARFAGLRWTRPFEEAIRGFSFRTGRRHAYIGDLGPEAVGALEQSLGSHLKAFGYEDVAPSSSRINDGVVQKVVQSAGRGAARASNVEGKA